MHRTETDLLNGSISRQLLKFFFPIMFGSLFQQLYNTVDAIVVGNYVGKEALGAVGGSTGTLINLLVGFTVGLSSGATVVIAQAFGKGDRDGVRKGVCSGMFLAVTLGAVIMAISFFTAPDILRILNVPEEVLPYSVTYFRIFMIGFIPSMVYNTGAGILRAIGDSKRPLYFLIASCITNIVLDISFVCIFQWGIVGVAAATAVSQIISCVLTMIVLGITHESYHFDLKMLSYDKAVMKRIVSIGLPTGIQSSLYSVANLFIQTKINSHGTNVVAAFTAFGKIDAVFWNTSGALGAAVLTFIGQNFGAQKYDRVRKGMREALVLYIVGALIISGSCYVLCPFLYRLFSPDPQVIEEGVLILRCMCLYWVTYCFVEIFSQSMRACGDSLVPMLITVFGIGVLRIVWILFFAGDTIEQALQCYPVSWIMTSLLFLFYHLFGGWQKRAIAKREKIA